MKVISAVAKCFVLLSIILIKFPCFILECLDPKPLGMENGQIKDDQIRASSRYNHQFAASNGRLNLNVESGAWAYLRSDQNPWLQVDFMENTTVTAISTQGQRNFDHWVKNYTVSYSSNGTYFQFYEVNGQIKVVS